MEFAAPDIEMARPGSQSPLRGREAMRAWMEPDAFEEQKVELIEFRVNGDDVLVRQHTRSRGAESGIELDTDAWALWTFGDHGLVTRVAFYLAHEEDQAFRDAGLRP